MVAARALLAAWDISAKSSAGTSWKLRTYAICADAAAVPGHKVVAAGDRLLDSDLTLVLDAKTVYSVPTSGGWTSMAVRVPPPTGQKVPLAGEVQQYTVCLN